MIEQVSPGFIWGVVIFYPIISILFIFMGIAGMQVFISIFPSILLATWLISNPLNKIGFSGVVPLTFLGTLFIMGMFSFLLWLLPCEILPEHRRIKKASKNCNEWACECSPRLYSKKGRCSFCRKTLLPLQIVVSSIAGKAAFLRGDYIFFNIDEFKKIIITKYREEPNAS